MPVADLSSGVLYVLAAALGVVGGLAATRIADSLPRRYVTRDDITLLTTGAPRRTRNLVVFLLCVACALGLAHTVADHPSTPLARAAFWFATNFAIVTALLAAAAIDVEHMILPNELTLGGAVLALATSPFLRIGWKDALVGVAVGLLLSVVPHWIYKKLRRHSGQGFGDAKLAILAGAWLGPFGALFVIFGAAVQSVLAALVMKLLGLSYPVPASVRAEIEALRAKAAAGDKDAQEELDDDPMAADVGISGDTSVLSARLPLGPFLVLSCLEALFFEDTLLAIARRLFGAG